MNRSAVEHLTNRNGEEGQVLILALAVLVVVGALTAALVGQSSPSFGNTPVVAAFNDTAAAADAGIRYGIQALQTDSTLCAAQGPSGQPGAIEPIVGSAVNNDAVTVNCQTLQGYGPGVLGWSIITNDHSPNSFSNTQVTAPETIGGPVFDAGGWKVNTSVTVMGGNAYSCPKPPPAVIVPPPVYAAGCRNTSPTVSVPSLPSQRPPVPQKPFFKKDNHGNLVCTILYPGTYVGQQYDDNGNGAGLQNLPDLSSASQLSGNVYLASGVYYFDNVGQLDIGKIVFGGAPAALRPPAMENKYTPRSPCGADSDLPNHLDSLGHPVPYGNGQGVEIILGGDSSIHVETGGDFEIYTRVPNRDDGSTGGVSLYQVPASTGWATKGSADPFFVMSDDTQAAVHGAVYGPNHSVVAYAQDYLPYPPVFNGGVDVFRFTVRNDSSSKPLSVATIANTPGFRYVLITAQAAGRKPMSARAVVRIENDSNRSVSVQSWRLCQDLWCSPSQAPG